MKITKEQIKALKPCEEGYEWYLKNGTEDLLETLLNVNVVEPSWARWLFTHLMSEKQRKEIAIFSAEQALPIFENKYPKDDRPRKAIEAAKAYLKDPSRKNKKACSADAAFADAAAYAAYSAAYAAAYSAAYAAHAAHAAYAAAAAADAASDAKTEMQERIIKEAVRIMEGEK